MKIVIVVHYIFPHVTGTDVGAYEQARRYVRLGHEVTMISSNLHKSPPEEMSDGIRVLRVKALNFLESFGIPYPLFSPALSGVMKREIREADIVHVHGMLYWSTIVAIRTARRFNKPIVLTQTAPDKYHYRPCQTTSPLTWVLDRSKGLIMNSLEAISLFIGRRNIGLSDQVTCLSKPLKRMLVDMGISEERIQYISNGVDTDIFHPVDDDRKRKIREELGLPLDRKLALSVGRFVPKKGLDIFIGAAAPEYDLVIVSRGNFEPLIAAAGGPVHVLDPMPQAQLATVYQACDVFVLAAAGEDVFSLVLMEAMAAGLPIITVNDPFFLDYIDPENVVLCEKTSDSIRDHLKRITGDDRIASRMADYSRARTKEVFSWDGRIQQYVDIYNRLLAEKQG